MSDFYIHLIGPFSRFMHQVLGYDADSEGVRSDIGTLDNGFPSCESAKQHNGSYNCASCRKSPRLDSHDSGSRERSSIMDSQLEG